MNKAAVVAASICSGAIIVLFGIFYFRNHPSSISQGITGTVIENRGNCMPPAPCPDYPISVRINVYKAISNKDRDKKRDSTAIVASTVSGTNGKYSIALPPGVYSVIPVQNGVETCSTVSGSGHVCEVIVPAGVTEYEVRINNAIW